MLGKKKSGIYQINHCSPWLYTPPLLHYFPAACHVTLCNINVQMTAGILVEMQATLAHTISEPAAKSLGEV